MPKAEIGTAKYVSNKLKSKGLQRLRWYCQACEKQCRDENGFRCHSQSESHLRRMLQVGKCGGPSIETYSRDFERGFVYLLRTSHGDKLVGANRVYNEYIQDRNHVHMNATRWSSLSGFVRYLTMKGVCRSEERPEGLFIAWIDKSPEAALREKVMSCKRRAAFESKVLALQMERARALKGDEPEKCDVDEAGEDAREALTASIGFSVPRNAAPSAAPKRVQLL